MKVLVTGSEGNIGRKLVPYLKSMKYEVFCVDIKQEYRDDYVISDITNPIELTNIIVGFKPDIIVHLAAMVSRITCEKSSAMTINSNLCGLNNMINLCKINNSKLVYFSTSEIYGNIGGVLGEDRGDIKPNNRYGLSKYLGEKLVEYEVEYHGLDAIIVRPFMFYDEDENFGENRSAMIRFVEGLIKNEKIDVHKGAKRSWLHISDAVRLIEKTFYLNSFEVINLASDEIIKMEEFANVLCNILNKDYNILCNEIDMPNQMTLEKIPSTIKMFELLKYKPKVDVETGLNLVVEKVKMRLGL